MSGIFGVNDNDYLSFIPGDNSANNPFVFPGGLHWMVEVVASNHTNVNHPEGSLLITGDEDDTGLFAGDPLGVDRFGIDVTETQIDVSHRDANDANIPDTTGTGAGFGNVRKSGLAAPPRWDHIAVVRDRQNDRLELWINGTLESFVGGFGGGEDISHTAGNLYVGTQKIAEILANAGGNPRLFRGEIDTIKIMTRDTFGAGSQFGPNDFGDFTHIVPEPTSLVLLLGGMLPLVTRRIRR